MNCVGRRTPAGGSRKTSVVACQRESAITSGGTVNASGFRVARTTLAIPATRRMAAAIRSARVFLEYS